MTHDLNPLTPAVERSLRDEAQALRREAPASLHAAIMERVQAEREQAAPAPVLRLPRRRRFAWPAAAAVILVLAGWGSQQWMSSQRSEELGPVSMHVLQEVTAAPARAVRKLTDAPALREASREFRGAVADEFDGFSARAGALGLALARRLGGPLSRLSGALR